MKKIVSKTQIKVPFYDLDPMNIVWHGNYVKYLEKARCDFFDMLSYNYTAMYNDGIMYPIAKMEFKFIKSAKFGENLTVECILKELEPAVILKYNVYTEDEKILTASTMQIGVDVNTGETIYNAPEKLRKIIEDYNE